MMKTQAKSQEPVAIIELYLTKPFQSIDRNITSMIIIDIAFISYQFEFINIIGRSLTGRFIWADNLGV